MRGKEKLIPHAARAGQWLEEQSWASALPSFTSRLHRSAQGVHTTTTTTSPGAYIGCVYRGGISGGISGVKGGGATGAGSHVPTAKVPLPRNAFGMPEGCGGAADVCIPSARREGAALRTIVSSTARTTVHGAAGREAVWNGCRCRTTRFRRARSARQTTRRTRKVCIPSPIPSVCTARCCAQSASVNVYHGDAVRSPLGELGDSGGFASLPPRLKAER